MSKYQNPYIYRVFELGFPAISRRTHRTLGDHQTQVSTAFWSNWIGQGSRGERREASHPILEAGGWPEELLVAGQGHNEEATVTHPTPPPPLEDPLGEFPSPCRIRRVKPHRKWCPIARAMPCSGETPPLAMPPPRRCRLSRPRLDQRLRLDHRYPFILIKSEPQIEESTAESDSLCRGPMSRDRGPGPWDCGPIPQDF
jgi:hypothetical protein